MGISTSWRDVCRRRVRWTLLMLLFAVMITASSSPAATVYVDDDPLPCGPPDGSSGCPYLTIQEAVTAAAVGDQVEVLPGHYCGQVIGSPVVFMRNGIDVVSRDGAAATTIDAGGGGGSCLDVNFAAVRFSNTSSTSTLVTYLDGFTITGGKGRLRTSAQRGQPGERVPAGGSSSSTPTTESSRPSSGTTSSPATRWSRPIPTSFPSFWAVRST